MAGADRRQGAEDRASEADLHRRPDADLHRPRGALGLTRTGIVVALPTPGLDREGQRDVISDSVAREHGPLGRLCPHCGSDQHGRPRILGQPDLHVSISYADGLAAYVVTSVPVGIDIEAVGAAPAGFADRAEWARTEAALKLTGEGLRRDPWSSVPDGVETVELTDLPDGFVGALAMWAQPGNAGSSAS